MSLLWKASMARERKLQRKNTDRTDPSCFPWRLEIATGFAWFPHLIEATCISRDGFVEDCLMPFSLEGQGQGDLFPSVAQSEDGGWQQIGLVALWFARYYQPCPSSSASRSFVCASTALVLSDRHFPDWQGTATWTCRSQEFSEPRWWWSQHQTNRCLGSVGRTCCLLDTGFLYCFNLSEPI